MLGNSPPTVALGSGDEQGSASRVRKRGHLMREPSLSARVSGGQELGALQVDVRPEAICFPRELQDPKISER